MYMCITYLLFFTAIEYYVSKLIFVFDLHHIHASPTTPTKELNSLDKCVVVISSLCHCMNSCINSWYMKFVPKFFY